MTLELRNRLETSTGLTLPATLVWGYPTVAALGTYLSEQLQHVHPPTNSEPAPVEADHPELDHLSDEELAALLDDALDTMQSWMPDTEK
jgi:hypothetical protein